MTTWTESRARRAAVAGLAAALLAGCGGSSGASSESSAPAAPPRPAATNDPDAVLNQYFTPEQMKTKLKADPRFKGFDCAQASRTDTYGGRFIQCSKIEDTSNLFIRLETYGDPSVGDKVDEGLSNQGWVVYPADGAAVAVAGDPALIRDVIDALGT